HDRMMRAVQEDHAGHGAQANDLLRPLLERHPGHARLHAVACQVQIHAGAAGDEAWTLCRRAAELDPRSPSTALFVAALAERRQAKLELEDARYARARERIDALEKDFGGAVGALTLRCELQVRQGSGPRGLRDCRRALERYPDSVHAQYLLGMALSTSRDWREA